ncbi:sensor histidine kinase [Sphingomonas xinjiangensis]|uniref:histidine kinase n=1 Tax=Sphingomonas xinjiangensis TaxID=643568 RepID=A0A840YGF1_9SPHN|nr:sensor histidine kinase [Sphingomonas xinjiangensis]MBB5711924.1 two-component system CheB/CheR fusion protein [Sphingomonas xinjiangensis]
MTEEPGPLDAFPPPNGADMDARLTDAERALTTADAGAQASLAREQLWRDELQHRVRNMLAIVRSIFARTVAAGGDLEDVANHFNGRLDVLTRYQLVHGVGPDATLDFQTMVHDELQSIHAAGDPRVTCEGPEVRVPQNTAQLLGLALHELATNSIKFGIFSLLPERGTLAIRWRVAPDGFHFNWDERGMAVLGAAPLRQGFGREFIEQALPYQLGARATLDVLPGQVSCDIHVPSWDTARADSVDRVAS